MKLSLLNLVSFCTHWVLFQGCERDTECFLLAPSRSPVLCYCSGDLGSSLKAFCQCRFLQTHSLVVLAEKLIESAAPKPTGQKGAGVAVKLVCFLLKKVKCASPRTAPLSKQGSVTRICSPCSALRLRFHWN